MHDPPTPALKVIHNASIMNAIGACGLQLYRFGEAISIVFFTGESLWCLRVQGRGACCSCPPRAQ